MTCSTTRDRYAAGELDAIRYAEFLAKYGLGTRAENEDTGNARPIVVRIVREGTRSMREER